MTIEVWLALGAIVLLIAIAYIMEHRVKQHGSVLPARPTLVWRLIALIAGLILAGMALMQIASESQVLLILPFGAAALLAYALGAQNLFQVLAGQRPSSVSEAIDNESHFQPEATSASRRQSRVRDVVIRWLFILGALAGIVYATFWIYTHPGNVLSGIGIWVIISFFIGMPLIGWTLFFLRAILRNRNR